MLAGARAPLGQFLGEEDFFAGFASYTDDDVLRGAKRDP